MIVDSSAVLAVLFGEADARRYADAIAGAETCRISAASFLEAGVIVDSQAGAGAGRQLDAFIKRAGLVIEPVTADQAELARQAYLDFGKGRHPPGLNYGDVFAYALAKAMGEPLLFKGSDFARTDIEAAI